MIEETNTILTVQKLLNQELSDNSLILLEQVRQIEAWHGRMTTCMAEAKHALEIASYQKLLAKSSGASEFERGIALKAAVANETRYFNILEGLCKTVSQRIILAQSILKHTAFEAQKNVG